MSVLAIRLLSTSLHLTRELQAFMEILIYRSLYPGPKHEDYWNSTDDLKSMYLGVTNALGRNRFLQIEACLHISDPDVQGIVFSKLEPVNTMLQVTGKSLWKASHTLAVDEAMS